MAGYFVCFPDYTLWFYPPKTRKTTRKWRVKFWAAWTSLRSNIWYPTFVLRYRKFTLGKNLVKPNKRRVWHRNNSVRSAQSALFHSESVSMSPEFRGYSEENWGRVRSVNNGSCRTLFCTIIVALNVFISHIVENDTTFCLLSHILEFGLLSIEKEFPCT